MASLTMLVTDWCSRLNTQRMAFQRHSKRLNMAPKAGSSFDLDPDYLSVWVFNHAGSKNPGQVTAVLLS